MTFLIVLVVSAVVVTVLVVRKRKDAGDGIERRKLGKQEPIAWGVERRKQFASEREREGKALIWYRIETYPGSKPEIEAQAKARAVEYSEKWSVLTRAVPVYPND